MSNRSLPVLDHAQLRRRRIATGFSQGDLADRAGITSGYVSLMERGQRQAPSPHVLAGLAAALGCTITDLMLPSPNGLSTGLVHYHGMGVGNHPGWMGHPKVGEAGEYPVHRHDMVTGVTTWETP